MKNTSSQLIEKYNTYRRRPTAEDPVIRAVLFKSFQRTLGLWLPASKDNAILDIACGEGSFLLFLKERGYSNLSGFDFSPENVQICHRLGLEFVQLHDAFDISELYSSQFFDTIFLIDFLEHVPKQAAAGFLEKVTQKLKPGGAIILQTPNMGCIFGNYHRYNDLSHEFGLTEKTIIDLLLISGFDLKQIDIKPAWNATTTIGYLREIYMRVLHTLIYLSEDSSRPRIPTKNLLIRAKSK
jgi:2-polyprenyl-3-methyl-5-hydroxy-6-metoxy-1,4-benzoquinol methylase